MKTKLAAEAEAAAVALGCSILSAWESSAIN